ncbi:hypothetical protein J3459_011209 [Metarhizium acridum]|nr:hypothetical protein J3459_011209 [Metarhizium acridum]
MDAGVCPSQEPDWACFLCHASHFRCHFSWAVLLPSADFGCDMFTNNSTSPIMRLVTSVSSNPPALAWSIAPGICNTASMTVARKGGNEDTFHSEAEWWLWRGLATRAKNSISRQC